MGGTTNVVVVGAGVVGCAVAYELACRGARVQVLDRRDVGQGATQASAGVLAPFIEAHESSTLLELGVRSLERYDEFVARVVEDSGSAVQYLRSGTLEIALDTAALTRLRAWAAKGLTRGLAAEVLDAKATREAEPQLSEAVQGGLLVSMHGFVGASDLVAALRRAAGAHGVSFLPSTSATRISVEGDGLRVEAAGDRIDCETVVLAAGSWSGQVEVSGVAPVPVRPVRGQLLHLGWPSSPLTRVIWAERCYLVPWNDGSVLAGATVEEVGFDERATVEGVQQLIDAVSELTPHAAQAWFKGVRVGLRPWTSDNLPVIGPSGRVPNLVYATGHFRNGILLAPLTASIVCDLILDQKQDPALDHTTPSRFEGL